MFVSGVGRSRSSTIFVDFAARDSGVQTSVFSDPFDSATSRRPNSLRVGNVSDTCVSPVNYDEYMMSQPYAVAKFCCAELASAAASRTGSIALMSITLGFRH